MDNIKVMLGRNGYPAYFLDSCVRRFFNRKYDKMLSHLEKYKLTCSCGSSYIGQTRRNLINRLKEHSSSDKSEVCRHLDSFVLPCIHCR